MNGRAAKSVVWILLCVVTVMWWVGAHPAASAVPTAPSPSAARQIPDDISTPQLDRAEFGGTIDVAAAGRQGLTADVLHRALLSMRSAVTTGALAAPRTLTVIDYSRPSTEPRLWVFDLASGRMLFRELVAHGKNTGDNFATRFSDNPNSLQSSLGLFVTGATYTGNNGYSLRLNGLEPGFNGHALERAIVVHGAPYVNATFAASQGRLGRSWGCPALNPAVAREVIDTIRGGGAVFAYYPDPTWLSRSRFLQGDGAATLQARAS